MPDLKFLDAEIKNRITKREAAHLVNACAVYSIQDFIEALKQLEEWKKENSDFDCLICRKIAMKLEIKEDFYKEKSS